MLLQSYKRNYIILLPVLMKLSRETNIAMPLQSLSPHTLMAFGFLSRYIVTLHAVCIELFLS